MSPRSGRENFGAPGPAVSDLAVQPLVEVATAVERHRHRAETHPLKRRSWLRCGPMPLRRPGSDRVLQFFLEWGMAVVGGQSCRWALLLLAPRARLRRTSDGLVRHSLGQRVGAWQTHWRWRPTTVTPHRGIARPEAAITIEEPAPSRTRDRRIAALRHRAGRRRPRRRRRRPSPRRRAPASRMRAR